MKNIILLSLLSIILLSCNKDENKEFNGNIVGMSYTNYSGIIFTFSSDEKVIITAKTSSPKDRDIFRAELPYYKDLLNDKIRITIPDTYIQNDSTRHYFIGIITGTRKEMTYTGPFKRLLIKNQKTSLIIESVAIGAGDVFYSN